MYMSQVYIYASKKSRREPNISLQLQRRPAAGLQRPELSPHPPRRVGAAAAQGIGTIFTLRSRRDKSRRLLQGLVRLLFPSRPLGFRSAAQQAESDQILQTKPIRTDICGVENVPVPAVTPSPSKKRRGRHTNSTPAYRHRSSFRFTGFSCDIPAIN
jgi:hypothetical protein